MSVADNVEMNEVRLYKIESRSGRGNIRKRYDERTQTNLFWTCLP